MNVNAVMRRQYSQAGFTLLEVLVAVVVLGLAYVALMHNFSISLDNVHRIETSKRGTLQAAAEMDAVLRDAMEARAELPGAVHLEGRRYMLMLVSSSDGELTTLRLTRKPEEG